LEILPLVLVIASATPLTIKKGRISIGKASSGIRKYIIGRNKIVEYRLSRNIKDSLSSEPFAK
jgi:hypothetical protein